MFNEKKHIDCGPTLASPSACTTLNLFLSSFPPASPPPGPTTFFLLRVEAVASSDLSLNTAEAVFLLLALPPPVTSMASTGVSVAFLFTLSRSNGAGEAMVSGNRCELE